MISFGANMELTSTLSKWSKWVLWIQLASVVYTSHDHPTPKQKKQLSNTVELDLIRKPTTSGKQKKKGSKNLGFVSLLSVFLSRSNSWVLILFDGFGSLEISMMHAILSICVAHMLQLLLCKIGSRNWCVYGCGVTVIQSGPIKRKNSKYFGQG